MKTNPCFVYTLTLFLGLFINPFFAKAGNPYDVNHNLMHSRAWSFSENKGQLLDENQKPLADIPFYGKQGGVVIYCKAGVISFAFTKTAEEEKVPEAAGKMPEQDYLSGQNGVADGQSIIIIKRADIQFLNANLNAKISATDEQAYYENYYNTGDANKGISHVHTFKTVTYSNIYPKIDLVLQCRESGIEYSFVVRPGGNAGDIQMQWNGVQDIKELKNGGVAYELPAAAGINNGPAFTESAPYSYQTIDNKQFKIGSSFIRHGSRASLSINHFDKTKTLVIDPSIVWGTYYGGGEDDVGSGITRDVNNNIYITGYCKSVSGIATSGAYQTTIGGVGTNDAFVAKFTSLGSLAWASYYGGPKNDFGKGVITDADSNVYIIGSTVSASGIGTSGSYKSTGAAGGFSDAFIAKFSHAGTLAWGTYYGGSGGTNGYAITADANNNIYVTGSTLSTNGIATAGAYQTRSGNAFLAKFTSNDSLVWGTYYGGGNDVAQGIAADPNNNIYITGYTPSKTRIASAGAYQTSLAGATNAFVAKFSDSGSFLWGTYYGGESTDIANGISADANGDVYIIGSALSTTGIASAGAYQTINKGNQDAFIAKLTSAGSLVWGTYYGASGKDAGQGIDAGADSNVYIIGTTHSENGLASKNAYKTFGDSVSGDAFMAKFTSAGNLSWGTYYGGDSNDVGNDIIYGGDHNFFVTGFTESKNGIATFDAYQTLYNYPNEDVIVAEFSFKINVDDVGISAIVSPAGKLCTSTQIISVVLTNHDTKVLTSVALNLKINLKPQNIYYWSGKLDSAMSDTIKFEAYDFAPGNYNLVAWTYNPDGAADTINGNDTAKLAITVNPLPVVHVAQDNRLCANASDSIGAGAVNGDTYSWSSKPKGFTSSSSNPVVAPTLTTTYFLTETTTATGCSGIDSVILLSPFQIPGAIAGKPRSICLGDSTVIGSLITIGDAYNWVSNPAGYSSTLANPTVRPAVTSTYTITEIITATGCRNSNSVVIAVNPVPSAEWTATVSNGKTKFFAADSIEKSYLWDFGDGFTDTARNALHTYKASGTYKIKLTSKSDSGCTAKYDSSIVVSVTGIAGPDAALQGFKIYPNPAACALNIEPGTNIIQYVTVFDATGREVYTNNFSKVLNFGKVVVPVSSLPSGIYFIKLGTDNGSYEGKFMKE